MASKFIVLATLYAVAVSAAEMNIVREVFVPRQQQQPCPGVIESNGDCCVGGVLSGLPAIPGCFPFCTESTTATDASAGYNCLTRVPLSDPNYSSIVGAITSVGFPFSNTVVVSTATDSVTSASTFPPSTAAATTTVAGATTSLAGGSNITLSTSGSSMITKAAPTTTSTPTAASSSAPSSTTSSKNGMPKITGEAGWMLGGLAAALVLAA